MPLWEAPPGRSPARVALFAIGAVLAVIVQLLTGLPYLLFLVVAPERAADGLALVILKWIAGLTWLAFGAGLVYLWRRRSPWTFAIPIASFAVGWFGLGFMNRLVPFYFPAG